MGYVNVEKQRDFQRQWVAKKRAANPGWQTLENKSRRVVLSEKINEIKIQTPCADCQGFFHPVCMDYDHLDRSEKFMSVSNMVRWRYAVEKILEEIEKCELVCANCHRLRTFRIED